MTYVVRNWKLSKMTWTPTYWAMTASEYQAQKARWGNYWAISDAEMEMISRQEPKKKKKKQDPVWVAWDVLLSAWAKVGKKMMGISQKRPAWAKMLGK